MSNAPLRACPTCATPIDKTVHIGLRDYLWLAPRMPGREAPMDLDFVVEKAGHILILETKPAGAPVPLGQLITLKAFEKLGAEVHIVWEHEDSTVEIGRLTQRGVGDTAWMTREELGDFVLAWRARYA